MFGIADYGAFVIAVLVFLAIPGPGNLALVTSTGKGGIRAGLAATFGVIAGDQVLMWLAVAGVATLLKAWPLAFGAVQWLGAAYLAWVGLRMILAKPGDAPVIHIEPRHYFRQGMAITLLNPKAIVFYMAFFPLFVDPAAASGPGHLRRDGAHHRRAHVPVLRHGGGADAPAGRTAACQSAGDRLAQQAGRGDADRLWRQAGAAALNLLAMGEQAVAGCDFDTAIGPCALAWRGDTLWQVRLAARHGGPPDAPPPWVAEVITRIQALLRGDAVGFDDVPLAWPRVPAFHRRVYEITRAIAPGATCTYGDIARQLGDAGAARAVGQALGHNPWPIVVPCHRVLAASGSGLGGFSAPGGAATKLRLLEIERAWPGGQPSLFDR